MPKIHSIDIIPLEEVSVKAQTAWQESSQHRYTGCNLAQPEVSKLNQNVALRVSEEFYSSSTLAKLASVTLLRPK